MGERLILPPLPIASFASLAVDLRLYAESAQRAAAAGELFVAQGSWSARFAGTVEELRRSAVSAGQLHDFFRARSEPGEEALLRLTLERLDRYAESRRRWRVVRS